MSEQILRILNKILGKYQRDIGIVVWGGITRTAQGDYRVVLVDEDGKVVASS